MRIAVLIPLSPLGRGRSGELGYSGGRIGGVVGGTLEIATVMAN